MRPSHSKLSMLAAAAALALTSYATSARVQGESRAFVAGRVLDATSGAPVESAVVSIRSTSGVQIDQARTRASGDFVLRDVPPGSWVLTVTRYGYEQYPPRSLPVQVTAGDRLLKADLRMARLAVLGGQITDESGDPVVGATVRVHTLTAWGTWDPGQSAVTDDRGRYRIWTLRSGDRMLSVQPLYVSGADGATTVTGLGPDAMVSSGGQTRAFRSEFQNGGAVISLAPGQVSDNADLRLTRVPASSISGRLDGAVGTVGNVSVQLLNVDEPAGRTLRDPIVAARSVSAADGRFTFPVVPAGRYVIKILKRPIATPTTAPSVTLDTSAGVVGATSQGALGEGPRTLLEGATFWASLPIVADGSPLRDLTIPLRPGAHIRGRIAFDGASTRPTPEQLNRAFLTAWTDRREFHPALIEPSGEIRTAGLPGGRYTLRLLSVAATGATWHPKAIAVNGRDVTDGYIDVGDTDVNDVVITLTDRAPAVTGTVRDARGALASHIVVVGFPADPDSRTTGSISTWRVRVVPTATGSYSVAGLLPGDYLFIAAADDLTERWNDPAVLDALAPLATRLRLDQGDQARLDLVAVTAFPSRATTTTRRHPAGPSADDEDEEDDDGQTPRDTVAPGVDRGAIQGRVTRDAAGRDPVRLASVAISPAAGGPALTQHTDRDGRFTFADVPAGRYRVTSSKAAHLTTEHGARRPGRPGMPVVVAGGGTVTLSMVLPPGSVITGRVVDERGRPISDAAVRVVTLRSNVTGPSIASVPSAIPAEALTDDRGEYRIYGLPAGEYYVGAAPPPAAVVGRETTERETSWVQSQRGSTTKGGAAPVPAPPPGPTVAQAPSFHPSAGTVTQAVPIALGPGEERAGVDIRFRGESVFTLTGTVVSSGGQPSSGARLTLIPEGLLAPTARFGSSATPGLAYSYGGIVNVAASPQGSFDIRSVAPGRYTLLAREAKAGPSGGTEWASTPITIDSGDRRDVIVSLQPTATVVAKLDSSSAALPGGASRLSLALAPASADPAAVTISGVKADAEGRFTFKGVVPGSYWLRVTGVPAGWALQGATAGGRDVLDRPLAVASGGSLTEVTISVSDRASQIAGTFTDASGRPATDYLVIAFPADREQWRPGSRYIQAVRPATDGRFTLRALPAGAYRLAAVWDAEPDEWFMPDFLAALLPAAIAVDVADGETRTQDIQVRRGPID